MPGVGVRQVSLESLVRSCNNCWEPLRLVLMQDLVGALGLRWYVTLIVGVRSMFALIGLVAGLGA